MFTLSVIWGLRDHQNIASNSSRKHQEDLNFDSYQLKNQFSIKHKVITMHWQKHCPLLYPCVPNTSFHICVYLTWDALIHVVFKMSRPLLQIPSSSTHTVHNIPAADISCIHKTKAEMQVSLNIGKWFKRQQQNVHTQGWRATSVPILQEQAPSQRQWHTCQRWNLLCSTELGFSTPSSSLGKRDSSCI